MKLRKPRWLHSLHELVRSWRIERLKRSRMGQKIIGLSHAYGYELVEEECTPKRLVFSDGIVTVNWE